MSRSRLVAIQQTLPFPKEPPRPTRQTKPLQKTAAPCPAGFRWVEPGEPLEPHDALAKHPEGAIGPQLFGVFLKERDRGAFIRPLNPPAFSLWKLIGTMKGKKVRTN